jgi:queuine tRNA-ribosyltransferase
MSALQILHRDPGSLARAGVLRTAHGVVRTPAFVPLATKGTVKGLEAREVAALGYDMVLGNTFHLFLDPGAELVAHFGGLHDFMGWSRPIVTDSGGFQVFSMGHGTVADEIKGRAPTGPDRKGRVLGIDEDGVRFRSYIDGSERFMGPETSMQVQAALGSDLALVFDECTPFNIDRDYTARSTERTHRWLDRCLAWHGEHGPAGQLVYGIIQGGVHEDLRTASAQEVAARPVDGIAIGGSLGAEKAQMYEVVAWAIAGLDDARPRHLLGIGDVDDLIRCVELGVDTFDCAMPTRLGRHGVAIVPEPDARWRVDLTGARWRESDAPIMDGCPCPACSGGHSRGYLRYLLRNRELTGVRLLTLHNLAFLARLMADLRAAIAAGTLAERAAALRAGAAPAIGASRSLAGGVAQVNGIAE